MFGTFTEIQFAVVLLDLFILVFIVGLGRPGKHCTMA